MIREEEKMFQVTEKASEMITSFLKDKDEPSYVRVFLSQGGWSGPSLGMALDEPKDNDEIIEDNGIKYLIDKTGTIVWTYIGDRKDRPPAAMLLAMIKKYIFQASP